MNNIIIGVTVGTPTSPSKMAEELKLEPVYYSTTREELAVTLGKEDAVPSDITSSVIWGLYDALMAKYPDRVQKNEIHNNDGSFTNYEYVVSTGEYNTEGRFFGKTGINGMDTHIKKPKYLILGGVHGSERPAIISIYRFIRDVLEGHNIPAQFREGCTIRVMPIAVPYGLDTKTSTGGSYGLTENGVTVGRNFDWNFGIDVVSTIPYGDYAESEKETQAIANWLKANQDAKVLFDCHNNGVAVNEVLQIFKLKDNEVSDVATKTVMRGVERVIPFWRDVIGYPDRTVYYSSIWCGEGGTSIGYATEKLGIPALGIELSVLQTGTQEELENDRTVITPETVAAGAEVIGNALIEFYEQSLDEVVDMTETNGKIDELKELVNKSLSFRIEKGVYTVEENITGSHTFKVPCTNGAKMLNFFPDEDTLNRILQYANKTAENGGQNRFVCFSGQAIEKVSVRGTAQAYRGYELMIKQIYNASGKEAKFQANDHASNCDNTDGFTFTGAYVEHGTYNWTAYYWDE